MEEDKQQQSEILALRKRIADFKKLEDSKENQSNIMESAPYGILELNPLGVVTYCNDTFLRLSGYSRGEIVSKHFTKLPTLRLKDIPLYMKLFKSWIKGETSKPYEFTWTHKDGTKRSGESHAYLLKKRNKINGLQLILIDISDHKQLTYNLKTEILRSQAAENELKKTIEVVPCIIAKANAHTRYFTHCNPALTKILGFSTKELLERPVMEFVHPDDRQSTIDEVEKQLKGSPVARFENRYICKDGTYKWLEWRATAANKKGETYSAATDITQRKKAEEALKESNDKFTNLANNISGYVAFVNPNTLKYEFVNDMYEKSFGIPKEEIIGRHIKDILGGTTYQTTLKHFKKVKSGKSVSYEHNLDIASENRWLLVNFVPVFDANKHITSIGVLNFDITERKQTEEVLRKSQTSLAMAQEVADMGSWDWNIAENTLTWSDMTFLQFGLRPHEVLPSYELFESFVHPDDLPLVNKHVQKALSGDNEYLVDARMISKDGREWIMRAQGKVTKEDNGNAIRMVGTMQDITERKQMENELQTSEKRLRRFFNSDLAGFARTQVSDGKLLEVNEYMVKLLGYKDKKTCLKDYIGSEHYVEPKGREKMLKQLKKTGYARSLELPITKCDGSVIWVNYSGELHTEENYIEFVILDITERKVAEEELNKKMHQLEIFNRAAVDRELKMVELKKEVNSLLEKTGLPEKYPTSS